MAHASEVAAQFERALEDLTFNSKPIILTLTEIARENIQDSRAIARVIVDRIKKVKVNQPIPESALSLCRF
jgi:pre-mRNA cleavage complex 2 protein Pcf11